MCIIYTYNVTTTVYTIKIHKNTQRAKAWPTVGSLEVCKHLCRILRRLLLLLPLLLGLLHCTNLPPMSAALILPHSLGRHPRLWSMHQGRSSWIPPLWPHHRLKNRSRCWENIGSCSSQQCNETHLESYGSAAEDRSHNPLLHPRHLASKQRKKRLYTRTSYEPRFKMTHITVHCPLVRTQSHNHILLRRRLRN